MSVGDRLMGLLCLPAYALQRCSLGRIRLHTVAVVMGLLGLAYVAMRAWLDGLALAHLAWAFVCLLWLCVLLLVWHRRCVVFRPGPRCASAMVPDLRPEQKLLLRGSGTFEVSNMRRELVEVPVVFWTTRLAEHVVSARVRAFNLLGLGVPSAERGWWYLFVQPRWVKRIEVGEICFGLRRRPAVRVDYVSPKGSSSLYLSCDDQPQLQVLVKALETTAGTWR